VGVILYNLVRDFMCARGDECLWAIVLAVLACGLLSAGAGGWYLRLFKSVVGPRKGAVHCWLRVQGWCGKSIEEWVFVRLTA
jgi:hypothetical protein